MAAGAWFVQIDTFVHERVSTPNHNIFPRNNIRNIRNLLYADRYNPGKQLKKKLKKTLKNGEGIIMSIPGQCHIVLELALNVKLP
jgi:hypothetical protein